MTCPREWEGTAAIDVKEGTPVSLPLSLSRSARLSLSLSTAQSSCANLSYFVAYFLFCFCSAQILQLRFLRFLPPFLCHPLLVATTYPYNHSYCLFSWYLVCVSINAAVETSRKQVKRHAEQLNKWEKLGNCKIDCINWAIVLLINN